MTTTEYVYKDSAGAILGVITRIDNKDGTKTFRASAGFPTRAPSTTRTDPRQSADHALSKTGADGVRGPARCC